MFFKFNITIVFVLYAFLSREAFAKQTYGYVEKIKLNHHVLSAKLDTGAKSSSLNAKMIKIFKKGSQSFVSFYVPSLKKNLERPLIGYVFIKPRRVEKLMRRPVVALSVQLGKEKVRVDFNLANRTRFNYPVLLGRNALIKLHAVVDASQTFTHKMVTHAI